MYIIRVDYGNYHSTALLDRRTERKAMRKQFALVIPILVIMIGVFAIISLDSVKAQNMSTLEINMTSGTNSTMDENTTSGNMVTPTNITIP